MGVKLILKICLYKIPKVPSLLLFVYKLTRVELCSARIISIPSQLTSKVRNQKFKKIKNKLK